MINPYTSRDRLEIQRYMDRMQVQIDKISDAVDKAAPRKEYKIFDNPEMSIPLTIWGAARWGLMV